MSQHTVELHYDYLFLCIYTSSIPYVFIKNVIFSVMRGAVYKVAIA